MDIYVNLLTALLSLTAIIVALKTFSIQKKMQTQENIAKCRIKASSISAGIAIRIENVGNSIIHISDIKCEAKDLFRNECGPHDSITRFFYGVPCKSRKEARLLGDYLFPNSNHNLFSITFSTQSDLMVAWEVVGKLEITVSFKDIYGSDREESKRLKVDYDSFWDAISIGTEQDKEEKEVLRKEVEKKSGYRMLASFEQAEN